MSKRIKEIAIFIGIFIIACVIVGLANSPPRPDPQYSTTYWYGNTRVSITFDRPTAYIEMEKDGKYSRIGQSAGYSLVDSETGEEVQQSLKIQSPPDGFSAQAGPKVEVPDNGAKIRFSIIPCGEDISAVRVLRWPVELFGCENPMEKAEIIPYTTEKAKLSRDKDKSYFTAEKGYLYSVYITWDEYYTEYCFIAE